MKVNEVINGFIVKSIKSIDDIGSVMYEFEHQKSGASLVFLENEDTNKCFTIGFRTLPEDSTGVCHIIEHSLLCGSEKYPLKEPFVNLMKGSMATFLNAFTASDWTMYPVASQNEHDFNNLISIYLDAVFAPLSVKDEKPFLQEGWHLEMNNIDDTPSYKGVVYNEMKGSMSSVNRQLEAATGQVMFKGSCYGFNSGGDPDVIPNLTFDYYKSFYKKYYNPDNGLIYLYGKVDIEEKLKFIDEEYLSKYERSAEQIVIPVPKPVIDRTCELEYQITENDDEKDNTYMSLCFSLDHYKNAKDLIAFTILNEALMSTNDSPLKKILMDAKLGQDVYSNIDDDSIVPTITFALQKTNKEEKDRFFNTLMDGCKKLVSEGIDKELLLATINNMEFKNKEMDSGGTPKGLFFAFSLMQSFNYRVSYENYLEFTRYYNEFRKELNDNYFEKLLDKYIVNSKHYVQVVLNPSKTIGKEKEKQMEEKMLSLKNNMTIEEKEKIVKTTKELFEYQSKKDTEEELKKLPQLKLSDISPDVNKLPINEKQIKGIKVLEHEFNTNKIAYLKMYFDLHSLELEDLPYLTILTKVLGNFDTANFTASKLQSFIKTYLGGFDFRTILDSLSSENCITKLAVNVSSLYENIDKMNIVIDEVLNKTIFDLEKVKIVVNQLQNRSRNGIIGNGMAIAMDYARRSKSIEGLFASKLTGINLYNFYNELLADFNDSVIEKLKDIYQKVFTKNNLIVSVSGDAEVLSKLKKAVEELPLKEANNNNYYNNIEKPTIKLPDGVNESLIIPSQVNYNAKACNLKEYGFENTGKLYILAHILNYDYLWSEIRVKGGAYGCTIRFSKNGDVSLGSYRDPNVANTYDVYNNISEYLENLDITEDEFNTYLIGAIGSYDQPLSNNSFISVTDSRYLLGYTDEMREMYKSQMIETTLKDIKSYEKLFKQMADSGVIYSIGNESKINEYSKFDEIKKL